MSYTVARDGQMYGPYTLEELRRYVASGNVLLTDMARSDNTDAAPEWLPVQQILSSADNATYPSAVTATGSRVQINAEVYPDPPNLPWGLVLLFNVLTCGLFMAIWNIVMAAWMRRVQPTSQAMLYYIGGAILTLSSSGTFFVMQHHHYHHHPFAGVIAIVGWALRLVARFSMKADMERHFNGPEPLGLQMSAVLTFFFGGLYIQSQLNRLNDIKAAIRFQYRGAI